MKFSLHIILLLVIFIVSFYKQFITNKSIKEGYQSYYDCVEQGYPLDFCLNVPAAP
jgi:hypothetical protein